MMKKGLYALLLCGVLLVGGCGSASNQQQNDTPDSPNTNTETSAAADDKAIDNKIASGTEIELTVDNISEYFEDKTVTTEKEIKNEFGEVTGTETIVSWSYNLKDEYKDLVKCDNVVIGATGCTCQISTYAYTGEIIVVPNADREEDYAFYPDIRAVDDTPISGSEINLLLASGEIPYQDEDTMSMVVIRPGMPCHIGDYQITKVVGKLIYK